MLDGQHNIFDETILHIMKLSYEPGNANSNLVKKTKKKHACISIWIWQFTILNFSKDFLQH